MNLHALKDVASYNSSSACPLRKHRPEHCRSDQGGKDSPYRQLHESRSGIRERGGQGHRYPAERNTEEIGSSHTAARERKTRLRVFLSFFVKPDFLRLDGLQDARCIGNARFRSNRPWQAKSSCHTAGNTSSNRGSVPDYPDYPDYPPYYPNRDTTSS